MNTCDTCKWWRDNDVSVFEGMTNEKKKICESRKMNATHPDPPEDGIAVGLVYFALLTGRKFGCVHHEPK